LTLLLGDAWNPIEPAIDAALAPFYMGNDFATTQEFIEFGKWDAWSWLWQANHGFRVRSEFLDDPRLVRATHTRFGAEVRETDLAYCDGGPKECLDLVTDREIGRATTDERRQCWQEIAAAHPPTTPYAEFRARSEDIATALATFQAQPAIVAWRAYAGPVDGTDPLVRFGGWDEWFSHLEDLMVNTTSFTLTETGQWFDDDAPGITIAERREYLELADRTIAEAPPTTMVVRLSFHY
jgi:hypothetical protein